MPDFKIHSDFSPTGDQPQAIEKLVIEPNKTLAAQLYSKFKEFFPENAVEFFVSYYDYVRTIQDIVAIN